ncbi:MAG: hypothetical protein U5K29_04510 [Acidimicrobiales bacterium]|nr:hypothetical protein [Acidimicrobiales bacterium]
MIATTQAWLPRFDTGQLDDADYALGSRADRTIFPSCSSVIDRRTRRPTGCWW